jgi:NTP pyrophosphatase (non-canonical NTP hydrolase)
MRRRAQDVVAQATEERGYRLGWSDTQFLARQIAKLQEELAELADCMKLEFWGEGDQSPVDFAIEQAGKKARQWFDDRHRWNLVVMKGNESVGERLRSEAADCQVVLFNIAATLERMGEEPYDVVEAAVEKSKADIKRGVR